MKDFLTTGEAAKKLGVSRQTVLRYINVGIIPACRFGKTNRIRKADLNCTITASEVKPDLIVAGTKKL
ncbi:MAG: helix-turn-helix domain-containing protein [Patescibacteria group bacterium]